MLCKHCIFQGGEESRAQTISFLSPKRKGNQYCNRRPSVLREGEGLGLGEVRIRYDWAPEKKKKRGGKEREKKKYLMR